MSYENFLIREMTEGADRWCSQCERTADDCACEELSDHFREVCSDFPVPVLAVPLRCVQESTQPAPRATDSCGGETSFSQWLEVHGDHLKLPTAFSEWLNQSGDSI